MKIIKKLTGTIKVKLKNIIKSIKSFGFKLLPNIVQQFFEWKIHLKDDSTLNLDTEFDQFLSSHLNHQYKKLYGIVNTETNSIVLHKDKLCIFSTAEKATDFYVDKGIILNQKYRLCNVDLSINILKIHRGF